MKKRKLKRNLHIYHHVKISEAKGEGTKKNRKRKSCFSLKRERRRHKHEERVKKKKKRDETRETTGRHSAKSLCVQEAKKTNLTLQMPSVHQGPGGSWWRRTTVHYGGESNEGRGITPFYPYCLVDEKECMETKTQPSLSSSSGCTYSVENQEETLLEVDR